jgi:hypothetical protein
MFRTRLLSLVAALSLVATLGACTDATGPDLNEGQGYNNAIAPSDSAPAADERCTEGQGYNNRC